MKKVLIVDDEEDMIWSLQKNLPNSKLKVETLTASSGEEALEVLNQTAVDLIVTDIKMPGMSGLDLLSEVTSRYPHLGVIVMTAYSSQEWETETILRGGYSYIEKPFDINEMRRVINQALQGKEDTMPGEPPGEDINDISTLAMDPPPAGENESPDYIVKTPENVQAVLSEEGDIEDSIVKTLLGLWNDVESAEDDSGDFEIVPADRRSIEETIVDDLLNVSEKSKPEPTNQVTSPLGKDDPTVTDEEKKEAGKADPPQTKQEANAPEKDDPTVTIQERKEPEKDDPLQIKQEANAPENDDSTVASQERKEPEKDDPLQTAQETGALENDESEETNWVVTTRDDYEPPETNWVINTRDNYEPEKNIQETSAPENDESEETNWVVTTRDDYEPPKTKWVINTRDNYELENDESEKTKWVIRTRND